MRSDVTLTPDDEGETVVNADGDRIGRVMTVERGTAHVDPDPGLADTIRSYLCWGGSDEEHDRLDASSVGSVSDNEVRLGR